MALLGNVVISKKILRTRKIMVMHSNERGEYCPRTLVDRKRKRYDNAVDVVIRLHDPTDPSTERTAPPSSAHVQLDDDPRTLIQQSVGDEFRQHDSVVTMMMFYRRRASAKLRDDMTEVEYGGGGHRTRLRNDHVDQLVCHGVPPAPVYKGARGEVAGPRRGRAKCGVLLGLPSPSRIPPPLLEKEGGAPPP